MSLFLILAMYPSWTFDRKEPLSFLGSTIREIFDRPLIPEEIFSHRGAVEKDDNVVFYYSDGFYLFWYDKRVWQIRYDRTFKDSIKGFSMGMDRKKAMKMKGKLLKESEAFAIFQIQDNPYPVRIKLYFENEVLEDLYIYRADY